MVVEDGLTLRDAGLAATLFCVTPSDQTTVHGPTPVNAAWILALFPGQIVPPPLTTAVGSARFVTVLLQVLVQPLAFVSVSVTVKLPDAPALTLIDCALVAPLITPLPLITHR